MFFILKNIGIGISIITVSIIFLWFIACALFNCIEWEHQLSSALSILIDKINSY